MIADTNIEDGTFMSIEVERWKVQTEMYITGNILLNYQKVMSPHLNEYIRVISPLDFEDNVNDIVGKMMPKNNKGDSSTE